MLLRASFTSAVPPRCRGTGCALSVHQPCLAQDHGPLYQSVAYQSVLASRAQLLGVRHMASYTE